MAHDAVKHEIKLNKKEKIVSNLDYETFQTHSE